MILFVEFATEFSLNKTGHPDLTNSINITAVNMKRQQHYPTESECNVDLWNKPDIGLSMTFYVFYSFHNTTESPILLSPIHINTHTHEHAHCFSMSVLVWQNNKQKTQNPN